MPKFQNKTNGNIDLIYNGRKIRIPPNGVIDGPPHLKLYKGLVVYAEPSINNGQPLDSKQQIELSDNTNKENIEHINKTIRYIKNYSTLPSVSICILTKNKLNLISDCINSLMDKIKYANTRIQIFDTGSDDPKVIQYYKTLTNTRIPITIHNVGSYHFSKNYNDGIKRHVETDYCVIQNNDTVAINDYISKLMKVAIVEKIGACGPRMLYPNGTIQHDGQTLFNHNAGMGFAHPGHVNMGRRPVEVGGGRRVVDGITAAAMLIRTKIFKEMNGFNINFKDIYQDVHFNMTLRGNGYLSICDWDAQIYHYDNTSRKELWNIHEEAQKMWRDSDYLFKELIPYDRNLGNFKRRVPTFSIITLVNNKDQYLNFLEDLKRQKFGGLFEIIALPNFNNEYSSASEALNVGKDLAEGDYVVYCHQDLRVPPEWLLNISRNINKVSNVGFFGMAGVLYKEDGEKKQDAAVYLSNLNSKKEKFSSYYKNLLGDVFEIQCLDELCIIGKRSDPYRFDENFNHYHWYGADICLQAIANGKKNYAINSECEHISDGISNFYKENHKEKYIEGAKQLYSKWITKIPKFRTTTASFNFSTHSIKFLVYDVLPEFIKKDFIKEINMSN